MTYQQHPINAFNSAFNVLRAEVGKQHMQLLHMLLLVCKRYS
jgi:hypothetical protein